MSAVDSMPSSLRELIKPLARSALQQVQPDDNTDLEESFNEILDAVGAPTAQASSDTLAFGPQDLVFIAAPAVLFAKEAVAFLWQESKSAISEEVVQAMRKRLHGLLQAGEPSQPTPLSSEQLRRLEKVMMREAKRRGVPADIARPLADATIRALVT